MSERDTVQGIVDRWVQDRKIPCSMSDVDLLVNRLTQPQTIAAPGELLPAIQDMHCPYCQTPVEVDGKAINGMRPLVQTAPGCEFCNPLP